MPAELPRIEKWMKATLSADPTITATVGSRIYADQAPQGAVLPLVVFAHIGNVDVINTMGNGRMAKVIFLVRVVTDSGSTDPILAAADRFDPLLLVNNVTIDGVVRIAYVQHFQHHIRKDAEYGVPMTYVGSYYYIFCQPAA